MADQKNQPKPTVPGTIVLNRSECEALYAHLDKLSGGKPKEGFKDSAWHKDEPNYDPTSHESALAKIYGLAGKEVPECFKHVAQGQG